MFATAAVVAAQMNTADCFLHNKKYPDGIKTIGTFFVKLSIAI